MNIFPANNPAATSGGIEGNDILQLLYFFFNLSDNKLAKRLSL